MFHSFRASFLFLWKCSPLFTIQKIIHNHHSIFMKQLNIEYSNKTEMYYYYYCYYCCYV